MPASDQAGSQTKRCIQSTYSRREIQTILLWPCTQKGIDQQSLLRLHPLQICVQHLGASTHVYTYTGHGHHRATSPTRLQRHRTSCAESLFKRSKGSVLAVGLLLSQRHHPCCYQHTSGWASAQGLRHAHLQPHHKHHHQHHHLGLQVHLSHNCGRHQQLQQPQHN